MANSMQYIRESRDGKRQSVTEWEWRADCAAIGYRSIHQVPNLIIYEVR